MAQIMAEHNDRQNVGRAGQRQPEALATCAQCVHGQHRIERVQRIVIAIRLSRPGISFNIRKKRREQPGCRGVVCRDSPGKCGKSSPPVEVRKPRGARCRLEVGEMAFGLGRLAQRTLPSDGTARRSTS